MRKPEEIEALIARLERFQKSQDLKDTEFCDQFREYVGTTKTWRDRLCAWRAGDAAAREKILKEGLDLEKRAQLMEALVSKIDGRNAVLDHFFWEMPFTSNVLTLFNLLREQVTDRRNLYILATTGVGKSATAFALLKKWSQDTAYCRMHQGCRNREYMILARMAKAIGIHNSDQPKRLLMEALIDRLKLAPITMIIDEAHEMGTVGMKIVKTLIDETPSRFAQFCYPTEYDRMRTSNAGALDEAKQIFGRTMKPVFDDYRNGLRIPDIECYLRNVGFTAEAAHDTAPVIIGPVRAHGNLRVLDDAVREARAMAELHGLEANGGMIVRAVQAQCPAPRKD